MQAERVLLLGAGGKTGASYAALLQAHGHHVLWYDKNPSATPSNLHADQLTHIPHDRLEFEALKGQFSLLTLTPGVPLAHPFVRASRSAGIRVISEVAYAAPYMKDFRIIGITGTDGKSTTTTFTAQILRALGHAALECGNFGIPFSEIILNHADHAGKVLVAEFSSYQLEEPGDFSIDTAAFLNLAPDHLNRYDSVESYGLAKWNIVKLIRPGGSAIVASALMPGQTSMWKASHPMDAFTGTVITVDSAALESRDYFIRGDCLYARGAPDTEIISFASTAVAGRHNFSNVLFAAEAAQSVIGKIKDSDLASALAGLVPLPHRFEYIPQRIFPQMTFINDSKATTTQAAAVALANAAQPVFIFLGGQGKGERYAEFGRLLKSRNAQAFIYGECRNEMAADFRAVGFENYTLHENLFKAFHAAKRIVIQRNLAHATLLLSPAVTSWDQFSSFEERGDYFRELVRSLQ